MLGLRERRGDAAVSPHFGEVTRIAGLFPSGPLAHTVKPLISSCGASA